MESLYQESKTPPPTWDSGTSPQVAASKANELVLPDGYRP
jgi:hypothetical protein